MSRRKCGKGLLLNGDRDGPDGVELTEWEVWSVCRLGFLEKFGVISIGLTCEDKSNSSLLSDWTKGLVGGFKMKLDENDEDNEGARDRALSTDNLSADGKRESSW